LEEEFTVSLRNRPVRRGLVVGFAVAFFGSVLALGCVQGPKGAFNRVWGTDGVASKTAKSLKSLGRRGEKDIDEEKALAEKDKKTGKKNSKKGDILQASGEKPESKKKSEPAGRSWITRPAQFASALSNGITAAPFIQKREPKSNEVQDPFLNEFERIDIAKNTATKKPSAKSPVAAPASRPANTFAPGFDAR
jgi:hypothetical protein